MDPIVNRRNDTIRLESPVREKVILRDCENCTIEGETFAYNGDDDQLVLEDCVECKIERCTFRDKTTKGNFIHLKGEKSRQNLIEGCVFRNHTYDGGNGGEAIIVGDNDVSGCTFETTIKKCEFIRCKGDDEIVSIKSSKNVFEKNKIHDNCDGNITIRHGGFNEILDNMFEGSSGGIRVYGEGNKIKGNYHRDNDNDEDNRRPLLIENGTVDDDPGIRNGEPIGRKISDEDYDGYAQAKNNIIEDNTYEDCKGVCILGGRKDRRFKPRGNRFRKNTLIADRERSEFVKFINGADIDENTFEDNKMYGGSARPGDLPERAVEHLERPPQISVPDAGP